MEMTEKEKDNLRASKYYWENRERILEKIKSDPKYKEKAKERNEKRREYKTQWAREMRKKNNEKMSLWRENNRERIREKDRERYQKMKKLKQETPEYLTKISKNELIEWAVEFVDRVESRKGMVSFEELFGELLGIGFYIPTSDREDDAIEEQLTKIWGDVKYFANGFKKELEGVSEEYYNMMRDKGICRYCEVNKIECSNNTCYKCKTIMIYINKLG